MKFIRLLLLAGLATLGWFVLDALNVTDARAAEVSKEDVSYSECTKARHFLSPVAKVLRGQSCGLVPSLTGELSTVAEILPLAGEILAPTTTQVENSLSSLLPESFSVADVVRETVASVGIATPGATLPSSVSQAGIQTPSQETVALHLVQREHYSLQSGASATTAPSFAEVDTDWLGHSAGLPFTAPAVSGGSASGAISPGSGIGAAGLVGIVGNHLPLQSLDPRVVADTAGFGCGADRCHGNPAIWPD